jgi:hypothetical protein
MVTETCLHALCCRVHILTAEPGRRSIFLLTMAPMELVPRISPCSSDLSRIRVGGGSFANLYYHCRGGPDLLQGQGVLLTAVRLRSYPKTWHLLISSSCPSIPYPISTSFCITQEAFPASELLTFLLLCSRASAL